MQSHFPGQRSTAQIQYSTGGNSCSGTRASIH
jgi:hypothetical protein